MIRPKPEALELFHRGMLALSEIESTGMLVDEEYLNKTIDSISAEIKSLESELKNDKIFKLWRKRFGDKTKLGSRSQLEVIIFDELGHERTGRTTETGLYSSDAEAFINVDEPFVTKYFLIEQKKKLLSTYLSRLKKELINGRVHPIYNLHTVASFRSSADRPSIQNNPVRDFEMGQLMRRNYIAPKGYVIGEIDYKAIEVCISACYNKDPNLIHYIEDPRTDMHRDMAMECYKLKANQVSKDARYCAKNMFVFPQFYGSYYVDCSKNLWDAIDRMKLATKKETPLKKHLAAKGITKLGACNPDRDPVRGTFECHIQGVEKDFWGNRFKVYKEWKWDWWNKYLDRGWFRLKTGFVCRGIYDRKQAVNYPIQGSAFHCLLWSMVELHSWLKLNKMKSKIIGEIHDSIIMYFHKNEIDDVIEMAKDIMTLQIRDHWKWIIVPLNIEVEIAPKGGSWADKKPYEIK